MEHLRWIAVVTYRSESGPIEVDHHFEELEELQRLIERGPDWNTIVSIVVTLNPERRLILTTRSRRLRSARGLRRSLLSGQVREKPVSGQIWAFR